MNDARSSSSPQKPQTVFQNAAADVLAQRLEGLALEIRGMAAPEALSLPSNETLGVLAATLRMILNKIDAIYEFEGFVFTPACPILLELFQARAHGSVLSLTTLCKNLSCPSPLAHRWVNFLESRNLLYKLNDTLGDFKISFTERGYLKTAQALQLLL